MTDEAIKSASLQSLPSVRRYVRAEGSAQRNDCYDTNSQTENQNPKGRWPQPTVAPWHVDREKPVYPFVDFERCNNHNPENDLRSTIMYLAMTLACCCKQGDEDFPHEPYSCQCIKKGIRDSRSSSRERK